MDDERHRAFLTLLRRHQDDLRAFIGSVVRDRTAIDDVVQETSLVLWRKFADYDPARPFGAWARGIAVLEIRKHWDRQRRVPILLSPEAIVALQVAWDALPDHPPSRVAALHGCLDRLPEPARHLLDLRYRDGLELTEVATRSGRGLEAVGKHLQRLRAALAECVQRHLAAEA